ncbi:MAG: C25 family cysteine peptidase, partial [Candidatus Thermoplasmatota archaeon]
MRKIIAIFVFFSIFLLSFLNFSTGGSQIKRSNLTINAFNNGEKILIDLKIEKFDSQQIEIDGKRYYKVGIEKEGKIMEKGYPELPKICRSVIIPDNMEMEARIIDAKFIEYENIDVAPSKGSILRTIDPDEVEYEFGEIYKEDKWYPGNIVNLREPYILRDFRGQTVEIYPLQYNPVQKKLRFYTDITLEIYPKEEGGANVYERTKPLEKIDREFNEIYKKHFINYNSAKYIPVEEDGGMLIICYDSFYSSMLPLVRWKNMKGIPTEIVNLSAIGNTPTAIKNYIVNYYNTHDLTFVLLVGDAQQVPSMSAGGYASDPSYSYIVGNDHYPDLFVGRFSAQNIAQVETQVNRSINYEKYPQIANWYSKGVGIASSQGPGDDNEYDYQHIRNIRNKLLNYTYIQVDELYDGSQGGEDAPGNPTPSMVASSINAGRGIINYCGHGSATSWTTSGFSNSDVNSLLNDNMLPFIWSVACDNGKFDTYDTCFAEAWLRATHNGQPIGAIATFMSSRTQYWNEPMDAQDEMVDILVETYSNNIKRTFGGISFNGCMHMNDVYGSSGYTMTDTWHVFGDPSLEVRTATPTNMSVEHPSSVRAGNVSILINVSGATKALCAVSKDGILLGRAYTNASGQAIINFTINETGYVDFVVTAYNKVPYITTIEVLPAEITHNFSLVNPWNLITIPVLANLTAKSLIENISACNVVVRWD